MRIYLSVPPPVSEVVVKSVNSSAINVSWVQPEGDSGPISHYIVWVRSLTDPADIHAVEDPASHPRSVIISQLSKPLQSTHFLLQFHRPIQLLFVVCRETYEVFVAAVGEEGMVRTLEARENITTHSDCNGTSESRTSVRDLMILCNDTDEGGIEVTLATLKVGEHSFHSI